VTSAPATVRLTQFAHGGGCACKIPPGELEAVVAGLAGTGPVGPAAELVVGLDDGDDAAVVRIAGGQGLVLTTDFFTPVVDDAYDFGRIAAANALSDVYAMGGTPVVAVNLLGWPRDVLPAELAAEVLRGGLEIAQQAGCHVGGGHSIDDPEPKYGMAVTGLVDLDRIITNAAAVAGTPLSVTKPLGVGVLNSRHKATGERFPQAVDSMTTLNRDAASAARDASSLSPAMVSTACAKTSPVALWRLFSTPTPSGLVRVSGDPAVAASLRMSAASSTTPVTASPYLGSGSSML
jgi:selenide,water dikinase